jgi:23S rRNA pseudouridine2605 synthase
MKRNPRGSNLPDSKSELRLQVYLSHCGVASRRASEKIILEGRVCVNGKTVTELGTKVTSQDEVTLDGKKIIPEKRKVYVLLNKPSGYVCSQSDEKGRPVAVELLKDKYSERLYNVGRLDMFSRGAIIFTNDGDFAARLSHPSSEIEKEYLVETSYPLPEGLDVKFSRGVRVEGIFYKAKETKIINTHKMKVVLVEGKNREIRRVFVDAGAAVRSLQRVRIGNITLDTLKEGESRELTDYEVKKLLELCKK